MSTFATTSLPKPSSWQDLEKLLHALCREEPDWVRDSVNMNGRPGEEQNGVDIFGRKQSGEWVGVQCKHTAQSLDWSAILKEVASAKAFAPPLSSLIVATTAPNDVKIQESARRLTETHLEDGLFTVDTWGWQDVELRVTQHRRILQTHWPELFPAADATTTQRPKFRVRKGYRPLSGSGYRPEFHLEQLDGDPVRAVDIRFVAADSQRDWQQIESSNFERTPVAPWPALDLESIREEARSRNEPPQLCLEIRFNWRGSHHIEPHTWLLEPCLPDPASRLEVGRYIEEPSPI